MELEKVYLFVSKSTEATIIIGKVNILENTVVGLEDTVLFTLAPTERGITPHPSYFPNPFMGSFVKKEALDNTTTFINQNDFVWFEQKDINPDFYELYRKEINKRNGVPEISIVQGIPSPNLKIVK